MAMTARLPPTDAGREGAGGEPDRVAPRPLVCAQGAPDPRQQYVLLLVLVVVLLSLSIIVRIIIYHYHYYYCNDYYDYYHYSPLAVTSGARTGRAPTPRHAVALSRDHDYDILYYIQYYKI